MNSSSELKKKFKKVFDENQSVVLAEAFTDAHSNLVSVGDFNELKGIVKELGIKVSELAEAQRRTDIRMGELAEAQKKTETSLERLIRRFDATEERLEGISNSVGYSLENRSYKTLPSLLERDGIKIAGRIIRRYYRIIDKEYQINVFARAKKDEGEILVLGEVKVRPSKKEIDRFLKIAEYIRREEGNPDVCLLFVAHDYHPNTEQYLKENGIRYFWSYEMD